MNDLTNGIEPRVKMPNNKKVTVIIPSIGRETLQQCLDALERQTRRPDEVLIIQDAGNIGIGLTRNKGVMQAKGALIAMTDDDCVPPDNWIESLMEIQELYDADVVGGTLSETDTLLHAKRMRYPFPSTIQEDISGVVGNGANILFKRSLFEECLLKDGYIYDRTPAEDFELLRRLRKRGAKIMFTPNTVLHLKKTTSVTYFKRQFGRGISIAGLHYQYRRENTVFIAQPSLLWGHGKTGRGADWLKALWVKVIGPFDIKSFPTFKDYFVFWLGEKIQGVGFIWGMLVYNSKL